ncbi:hypothetical protein E2C01_087505 [Portunus trituberculatus]|uniref:Uncharacterized protein n=1 Tax=Portunus trituberculatus TaxID=210409 RepID=A0A5B7JE75_PORTR|nr:hypothetical protein [Portunus trituberculatus]
MGVREVEVKEPPRGVLLLPHLQQYHRNRGSLISSLRRGASLRRMSWLPRRPHLECKAWLSSLDLRQYAECFAKFDGVEVSNSVYK